MFAIIIPEPLTLNQSYDIEEVPAFISWADGSLTRFPTVGMTYGLETFVSKTIVSNPPTSLHVPAGSDISYDANTYTLTQTITFTEPPLEDMQNIAILRLTDWRNGKQDGGFSFANVVYESDFRSRSSIEGAVSMALIANMSNTDYSVSWTAMDNSQNVMDANTVIQFGVTAATAFQEWHATCLTLKDQVVAANNAAGIQAVLDSVGA